MKLAFSLILVLLLASCAETVNIKPADIENIGVKEPFIRTTKIEPERETKETDKEPKIDIIIPKDGEVFKHGNITVKLNISNFKLVLPDRYPQKGQGHVQVWFDGMEFRDSKTEFFFENESNGTHTIKAELMLSNNTVLPYSKTISIVIDKT
ncbi:Ig-like domain-containing protein [Candidatus Woesearchaeota archaeon]|nr:Ig-like domain-containing protein [Candidatus Woesearchaeota archaeon]